MKHCRIQDTTTDELMLCHSSNLSRIASRIGYLRFVSQPLVVLLCSPSPLVSVRRAHSSFLSASRSRGLLRAMLAAVVTMTPA
jgi:hypothetical protein